MDPDRVQAFEKLRVSAESILSRPEDASARVIGPSRGLLECSIVTRPAFAPSVAFAILRTRPDRSGTSSRRICRVFWNSPQDLDRLNSMLPVALMLRPLDPSIDIRVIDAPAEVTHWLTEAASIRVPLLYESGPLGTDGESTTVQFGEGFHASVFRWWCSGPNEWAPLVDWAERVRARLDALFSRADGV